MKRITKEQLKFSSFWLGIKRGVDAFEHKSKQQKDDAGLVHKVERHTVS